MKSFFQKYKVKTIIIILILLICGTLAYISTPKKVFKLKPPEINENQLYKVVNVLDGDTFEIEIDKKIWKVRMIGIDTPETVDPRKSVQCYGKEASEETKRQLLNKEIKIKTDNTQGILDKYNRVLAYVYLEGNFFNEELLKNGFAREYTYSKKYEMQKEFRKIEKEAKWKKVGLWEKCNP
jgi:micrococcal nuclease